MHSFDYVEWDDPADPRGNAAYIAEHEVTPEEVEEVLCDPHSGDDVSRSSGRPMRFGWTSTGKHIVVIYEFEDDDGFLIARPVNAYEVPPRS